MKTKSLVIGLAGALALASASAADTGGMPKKNVFATPPGLQLSVKLIGPFMEADLQVVLGEGIEATVAELAHRDPTP